MRPPRSGTCTVLPRLWGGVVKGGEDSASALYCKGAQCGRLSLPRRGGKLTECHSLLHSERPGPGRGVSGAGGIVARAEEAAGKAKQGAAWKRPVGGSFV